MKILFWLSIIWVGYVYVGYLTILILLTMFKKNKIVSDNTVTPKVSLIIAAHNEEEVIRRKILESLHSLDYPKDKLEIIVASDASNDKTDDIVRGFADQGVKLVRQNERKGKTAVQNVAAKEAKGEIFVFSDATTIYRKDVISKLVRNFSDPKVGIVGGEEHFIASEDEIASSSAASGGETPRNDGIVEEASFFWRYEKLLREKESEFNTMIGASGCVFAIRKELYEPLEDSLIEDFALPLKVASKGYKVVCEKEAIAYERAASNIKTELIRKARIVTGGINVLWKMRYLLNPFKYPLLSFQLFSHKIARWFTPVFMALLFISNMYLMRESGFFLALGLSQIAFYCLALMGYFVRNYRFSPKPIRIAYHFCVMNCAAVLGLLRFLRGDKKVIWTPVR